MERVSIGAPDEGLGPCAQGLVRPDRAGAGSFLAVASAANGLGAQASRGTGQRTTLHVRALRLGVNAVTGRCDKQASSRCGAVITGDAGLEVVGVAVLRADVPAFGAEVFGCGAGLVFAGSTALVGAGFAEAFTSEVPFAACNQWKLLHVGEQLAGAIGATGLWSSADAVVAGLVVGAEVAVVDGAIAVVIFSVADLFGGSSGAGAAYGGFAVVGADLGA